MLVFANSGNFRDFCIQLPVIGVESWLSCGYLVVKSVVFQNHGIIYLKYIIGRGRIRYNQDKTPCHSSDSNLIKKRPSGRFFCVLFGIKTYLLPFEGINFFSSANVDSSIKEEFLKGRRGIIILYFQANIFVMEQGVGIN